MGFETEFMPRLGRRRNGFKILFEHLRRRAARKRRLVLVETGCLRLRGGRLPWAECGCSSILFDRFAGELGARARFISIDHDKKNCALTRRHCPRASVICGDSVKTLYCLRGKIGRIDLLYLDSCDLNWRNPHASALHHLEELCAAAPMLESGAIVFVDDNSAGIGKGMYVQDFMKKAGARQICDEYQIGFVWP